jgi:hypothetical protein
LVTLNTYVATEDVTSAFSPFDMRLHPGHTYNQITYSLGRLKNQPNRSSATIPKVKLIGQRLYTFN